MTIKIQLSPKRCQQVTVSINPSGTMNIQIESGCHCKRNTGTYVAVVTSLKHQCELDQSSMSS